MYKIKNILSVLLFSLCALFTFSSVVWAESVKPKLDCEAKTDKQRAFQRDCELLQAIRDLNWLVEPTAGHLGHTFETGDTIHFEAKLKHPLTRRQCLTIKKIRHIKGVGRSHPVIEFIKIKKNVKVNKDKVVVEVVFTDNKSDHMHAMDMKFLKAGLRYYFSFASEGPLEDSAGNIIEPHGVGDDAILFNHRDNGGGTGNFN